MAKPFDAAGKELLELKPEAILEYVGVSAEGSVSLIESDFSTVTAQVDSVFRVDAEFPYLVHIELQANLDVDLPRRLRRYNGMIDLRHKLPILSAVILLRPEADHKDIDGHYIMNMPFGFCVDSFKYYVIRAWKYSVETLLTGDLGFLPFAPLADVPVDEVPEVLRRVDERLVRETTREEAGILMQVTLVWAGLVLDKGTIHEILGGLKTMSLIEESSYVRIWLDKGKEQGRIEGEKQGRIEGEQKGKIEGKIEGERAIIVRLGRKLFGEPDAATLAKLDSIQSVDRLDEISDRLFTASNWTEAIGED